MISPSEPAGRTTWLLVRMWPCSSRTKPVPVPCSPPPLTCRVTTLGRALAAIPATLSGARPVPFSAGPAAARRSPIAAVALEVRADAAAEAPRRAARSAVRRRTPCRAGDRLALGEASGAAAPGVVALPAGRERGQVRAGAGLQPGAGARGRSGLRSGCGWAVPGCAGAGCRRRGAAGLRDGRLRQVGVPCAGVGAGCWTGGAGAQGPGPP